MAAFFSPRYMYFSFIVQENLHKTEPTWIHVPTEIMDQIATKAQLFPSFWGFGDGPMGLKSLLLQRHWCAREKLLTCFFAQQGALANHASTTNDLCYSFVQTNKRNDGGVPFETKEPCHAPSSWRCFLGLTCYVRSSFLSQWILLQPFFAQPREVRSDDPPMENKASPHRWGLQK